MKRCVKLILMLLQLLLGTAVLLYFSGNPLLLRLFSDKLPTTYLVYGKRAQGNLLYVVELHGEEKTPTIKRKLTVKEKLYEKIGLADTLYWLDAVVDVKQCGQRIHPLSSRAFWMFEGYGLDTMVSFFEQNKAVMDTFLLKSDECCVFFSSRDKEMDDILFDGEVYMFTHGARSCVRTEVELSADQVAVEAFPWQLYVKGADKHAARFESD